MPVTYLSCTPQCKFWIRRSYARSVRIVNYSTTITWIDNVADVTIHDPFDYHHFFVFNPLFWAWNSNSYSLDFVLDDVYYVLPGDPTHYPFPVEIAWVYDPPTLSPLVQVKVSLAPLTLPKHALPAAPAGWWSG